MELDYEVSYHFGFRLFLNCFSSDHSHDQHHHHSDDSEMAMGPGGANEVINGIIKKLNEKHQF